LNDYGYHPKCLRSCLLIKFWEFLELKKGNDWHLSDREYNQQGRPVIQQAMSSTGTTQAVLSSPGTPLASSAGRRLPRRKRASAGVASAPTPLTTRRALSFTKGRTRVRSHTPAGSAGRRLRKAAT
ncbi:hypothetical protein IscW_ISCW022424, partial [Ixodes scapularis]